MLFWVVDVDIVNCHTNQGKLGSVGVLSEPSQAEYTCRACGKQFEILGDLQTHILLEHHQKGDIPDEAQAA